MKKMTMMCVGILASVSAASLSYAGVIEQDTPIRDSRLSKALFLAYEKGGAEVTTQGETKIIEIGGLRCAQVSSSHARGVSYHCDLLAGQWLTPESGSASGGLYTPATENAVFDLQEYLNVKPTIQKLPNGATLISKKLSIDEDTGLSCGMAMDAKRAPLFQQCSLLNSL